MNKMNRLFPIALTLLIVLSACTGNAATAGLTLAPLSQLPDQVREAPAVVQEAYRFAVANPAVLEALPCYCGCGAMGHRSNYNCYIRSSEGSESIVYDDHALGCTLCVDITRDAMRMLQDGQDLAAIQAAVDRTYQSYGPPTQLNP